MAKTEEDKKQIEEGEEQIDDLEISEEDSTPKEEKTKKNDGSVVLSKSKITLVKKLLQNVKENNDKLVELLSLSISPEEEARISIGQLNENTSSVLSDSSDSDDESRVIEGVFDGENMIGPDGKQYSVPANYASKSKLVEGDILKLTITPTGTFVYKQIGPIERDRIVADLEQTSSGGFIARADNKKWLILTASVTYFKGQDGDEIVILIPKAGESKWAAVENIVKKAK